VEAGKALPVPAVRARAQGCRRLISADPADVALIPIRGLRRGDRRQEVLATRVAAACCARRGDDHTSPCARMDEPAHEHRRLHGRGGKAAARGDWTSAVLEAIERRARSRGAGLVSGELAGCGCARHARPSEDGGKGERRRAAGDATHDAGVPSIRVKSLDPDPDLPDNYKWVLGPSAAHFHVCRQARQTGAARAGIGVSSLQGGLSARTRYISAPSLLTSTGRAAPTKWASETIHLVERWTGRRHGKLAGLAPTIRSWRGCRFVDRPYVGGWPRNSGSALFVIDKNSCASPHVLQPSAYPRVYGAGSAEEARGEKRLGRTAARRLGSARKFY